MEKMKEKRKLMAWIEVYGGQRSLAFELTTAILLVEIHNKCTLGALSQIDSAETLDTVEIIAKRFACANEQRKGHHVGNSEKKMRPATFQNAPLPLSH